MRSNERTVSMYCSPTPPYPIRRWVIAYVIGQLSSYRIAIVCAIMHNVHATCSYTYNECALLWRFWYPGPNCLPNCGIPPWTADESSRTRIVNYCQTWCYTPMLWCFIYIMHYVILILYARSGDGSEPHAPTSYSLRIFTLNHRWVITYAYGRLPSDQILDPDAMMLDNHATWGYM